MTVPRLRRSWTPDSLVSDRGARRTMLVVLAGNGAALWLTLRFFSAKEVSESLGYQAMFVAAWLVALHVTSRGLAVLGLDPDVDGFERRNAAARRATAGAWSAVTICAMGANLGEGDEVSTTLIPLALGVGGVLASAAVVAGASRGFAPVAVEQDRAAGLRLGGLLMAASVPLAHAASGDWVTLDATLHDFEVVAPWLGALAMVAGAVEVGSARARRKTAAAGSLWTEAGLPVAGYGCLAAVAWRFAS